MAYSETTAKRIRSLLASNPEITEKKMFGGLAFLFNGHMCCGINQEKLTLRIGAKQYEKTLAKPYVKPMDFTGKPMKGMVYIETKGFQTDQTLKTWVQMGIEFVKTLPKKQKKKTSTLQELQTTKKTSKISTKTPFNGFAKQTFLFLKNLSKNNNKTWFEAHREDYTNYHLTPAIDFVTAIGPKLQTISKTLQYDPRINGSLFRIQRDLRFAKDKSKPYKTHLDLVFWEGDRRGLNAPTFYLRLTHDTVVLGTGVHQFDKDWLTSYRHHIVDEKKGAAFEKVLKKIKQTGNYEANEVSRKTVPRGFDKNHKRAPLLLHDGFSMSLTQNLPNEVYKKDFVDWCFLKFSELSPLYHSLCKLA